MTRDAGWTIIATRPRVPWEERFMSTGTVQRIVVATALLTLAG